MTTSTLMATKPELAVYRALQKLDIEFEFQSRMMGGYREKGSLIADFYIPSLSLVIAVQGLYWHSFPGTEARDRLQRIALEGQGITTIWIDEDDALTNALYYVREALLGHDHSKFSRI